MTRQARINVYGPYQRGGKWRVVFKCGDIQQAHSFSSESDAVRCRDEARAELGETPNVIEDLIAGITAWMLRLDTCQRSGSYVYAVRSRIGGLTKIGVAIDPFRRLVDIQRMGPVPLELVALAHGSYELESRLHTAHVERRSHGEWFALNDDPMPFDGACFGCRSGWQT